LKRDFVKIGEMTMRLSKKLWEEMKDKDLVSEVEKGEFPHAMKHSFSQDLFCKWCGISFFTHWVRNIECGRARRPTREGEKDRRSQPTKAVAKRMRIDYIQRLREGKGEKK
jgi:hypothetical protein